MNQKLLIAALTWCVFVSPAWAQQAESPTAPVREMSRIPGYENRPVVHAERLKPGESVKLDGKIDEAFWRRAKPVTDFVQQEPRNGEVATEKTEVYVMFDERNLYIGAICYDSDPKGLRRNQMVRDGFLPSDDRFQWSIDPYLNGVSGYFFETNPSGVMSDGLLTSNTGGGGGRPGSGGGGGGGDIRGWDGIWDLRVNRGDFGWSVEIVIPFRTLTWDPKAPAWGINFQRSIRRKNEDTLWTSWGHNQGIRRMTTAGLLDGIEEISQGHGLTIQPYVIGKFQDGALIGIPQTLRGTAGADIQYSLTPKLKANVTINTDFAETEVDQRQVNLTQFALFFPEKRSFFLEGSNFLDFGHEPDNVVLPYFSRSIGLGSDLLPQRINFGAKVTGQVGAYDLGFLQVETGNTDKLSGENFTVFRGRRRFFRQSYVGTIMTRRADRSGVVDDRYTAGTDFALSTSRFQGNKNLELNGFYLWNTDQLHKGDNHAWGVTLDYPNDRWGGRASVREIGGGWNPAVGFLQRNDIRQYSAFGQFGPRPVSRIIRRYNWTASMDLYTDLRNVTRTRTFNLQLFGVELQSGDGVRYEIVPTFESPSADFTISAGVILPANKGHDFVRQRFGWHTGGQRKISGFGFNQWGSFYSGTRKETFIGISTRPRPGIQISAEYNWNRVELTEGKFTTTVYRLNTVNQFNPRMGISNNIQYDNVTRVVGWQSRFRWILRPGNDIYIVYSHNWLELIGPNTGFVTQSRNAASKIIYTKQF